MIWDIIGVGVFTYGLIYLVLLCFLDCDVELAFYEKFGKSVSRLKGRVVFITGASSGIGEHTAIALAKHGVKLVLAARRRDELERVKLACIDASQGLLNSNDVLVLQMDLLDLNSQKKHFEHAASHFNGIDIIFNNAGRSQRALWEDIDIGVDKEVFDLNVFSVVNLTRIAIHHFNQRGRGHVAVTSSLAGLIGVPFSASYTGSKHAIHGYMNSLRIENIGKNLSVSIFCPGPIFTNFLQESFTGKVGQKYGIPAQATDKRMTGERCGQLCAIGLANKCKESWMAHFPLIIFTYTAVYFPMIFNFGIQVLGPNKLFNMREGRQQEPLRQEKRKRKDTMKNVGAASEGA